MSTNRMCAQGACLAILLSAAGLARAEDASKPAPLATIGPAVPLGAEQQSALAAKRSADPGTRLMPGPPAMPAKLVGSPPVAPARPTLGDGQLLAPGPVKSASAAAVSGVPAARTPWRSVASGLGTIPRPEWSAPWMPAKPADVTVSRPLRPDEAAARAAATTRVGGSR